MDCTKAGLIKPEQRPDHNVQSNIGLSNSVYHCRFLLTERNQWFSAQQFIRSVRQTGLFLRNELESVNCQNFSVVVYHNQKVSGQNGKNFAASFSTVRLSCAIGMRFRSSV
jgi:hypothetical protein